MINWKRENDTEFYIIDGDNNRVLGPLKDEEAANHALKVIRLEIDCALNEYKEEHRQNFSEFHLKMNARERVKDAFLRMGSVIVTDDDADKISNLLKAQNYSLVDISQCDEKELWADIKHVMRSMPSRNYKEAFK